jgi:hypothetical protein
MELSIHKQLSDLDRSADPSKPDFLRCCARAYIGNQILCFDINFGDSGTAKHSHKQYLIKPPVIERRSASRTRGPCYSPRVLPLCGFNKQPLDPTRAPS